MRTIKNTKYEVLTTEGFKPFDGYYIQKKDNYIKFIFEDNNYINVTHYHRFFSLTDNQWKFAKDIQINEILRTKNGGLKVFNIETINEPIEVADLANVQDSKSYIANNIDCHNTLVLDEAAHIETKKFQEFFDSVYPTISAGKKSKLVMISTPKGLNHFYKFFNEAKNNVNNFAWLEVDWRRVPGRDEQWAQEERLNMGELRFQQEHEIDFLGSSNTLIAPNKIRELTPQVPILKNEEETYRIYEDVKPDRIYIISCDVSRGKGLDNSAFNVIDITEYPFRQVASFSSNTVSPFAYTQVINRFGKHYNNAYVIVENNEIGSQVVDDLNYDLEYENIISDSEAKSNSELGVRTTKSTKRKGCATLKELVESNKLVINDSETIMELSGFIAKKNSYEADAGFTDDLVMSLVILSWFVTQELFSDLTDRDVRQKLREQSFDAEEDLVPFGFIDDGVTDYENPNVEYGNYNDFGSSSTAIPDTFPWD